MFRASSAHQVLRHPPTTFHLQSVLTQAVYRQATTNSHREWRYHVLQVYNCVLLKMSTWGSKHAEENNILWINNNQCIKLVINKQYYSVIRCIIDNAAYWSHKIWTEIASHIKVIVALLSLFACRFRNRKYSYIGSWMWVLDTTACVSKCS